MWIEFIGTASNSSPNVLSFIVESNVNTLGIQQTIELFDFSNNQYQVNARIGWKANAPVFLFPWTVEIDHIQWNESN